MSRAYVLPPAGYGAPGQQIGSAAIMICVNNCREPHAGDLDIYSFQYSDGGLKQPVVRDFANGMADWGVASGKDTQLAVGNSEDGRFLRVRVAKGQTATLWSRSFAVTPAQPFEVRVKARVSAGSWGSAGFAVAYFDGSGKEILRQQFPLRPLSVPIRSVVTAGDGAFSAPLSAVPSVGPGFVVEASYPGDDARWPAVASYPLPAGPIIEEEGVVSAADFNSVPAAPGSWITIFGFNFGLTATWDGSAASLLGGAAVSICGSPATISYNSGPVTALDKTRWQLNVLVPEGLAGRSSCPVTVTVDGRSSRPATLTLSADSFELFTYTGSTGRFPVVTHADYGVVGPESAGLKPARAEEILTAWGTGNCADRVITSKGRNLKVLYAGRVSPGLCQVNFEGPDSAGLIEFNGASESYRLVFAATPVAPLDDIREWHFAGVREGTLGWTGNNTATGFMDAKQLRIENTRLVVDGVTTAEGGMSYVESPWFYAGDSGFSELVIRMDSSRAGVASLGFWIVGESRYATADTLAWRTVQGPTEYTIRVPDPRRLAGKVVQLRLIPSRNPEWQIAVESVRIE